MTYATIFVLSTTLACTQDTDDVKRAIAIVKKADGSLVFDEKVPGRPVISVNL